MHSFFFFGASVVSDAELQPFLIVQHDGSFTKFVQGARHQAIPSSSSEVLIFLWKKDFQKDSKLPSASQPIHSGEAFMHRRRVSALEHRPNSLLQLPRKDGWFWIPQTWYSLRGKY